MIIMELENQICYAFDCPETPCDFEHDAHAKIRYKETMHIAILPLKTPQLR